MSHHKAILWALGRSQRPLARRYDAAPVTASAISAAAASRTGQRRNLAQSAPNDRESIPTLDKPLGVSYLGISPELAQKISNRTASMRQRIQRSLQPEHLATQRQQLVKEFNRSYWQDFRDMSKRGGKQWIAPNRLLKQGVSLFMPSIYGRTLDRTSGEKCTTDDILRHKCTVVSIASTRFGERNIDEMIAPAVATFPRERSASHGVLFLHINLQENPLKAGLVQLFIPNIKRTIPKFSHQYYYIVTKGLEQSAKEQIAALNRLTGYVFLVDSQSRIRWAACAEPTPDEPRTLLEGIKKLLIQYDEPDPNPDVKATSSSTNTPTNEKE